MSTWYGYGDDTETEMDPNAMLASPWTHLLKLNWSRARCVPRMVNVFVYHQTDFPRRDTPLTQKQVDSRDHDWFWRLAAQSFSDSNVDAINFKQFTV